jgi:hypothetical protein
MAGMDIVGDWSPVRLDGLFRRLFHLTEHPALSVTPGEARRRNERTNQMLLAAVGEVPVETGARHSLALQPG